MQQSSEILYRFIDGLLIYNMSINFCVENFENSDSNVFCTQELAMGVQFVKNKFYNKDINVNEVEKFMRFLETAKENSIDKFHDYILGLVPIDYRGLLDDELKSDFEKLKNKFDSTVFYEIMNKLRSFEEINKIQNFEV